MWRGPAQIWFDLEESHLVCRVENRSAIRRRNIAVDYIGTVICTDGGREAYSNPRHGSNELYMNICIIYRNSDELKEL